jgi:hypothetical protein
VTTTHQGTTPEQSRPGRNEAARDLRLRLPIGSIEDRLLAAALDHARKEGREEAVREIRRRYNENLSAGLGPNAAFDVATEPERPTASEEER